MDFITIDMDCYPRKAHFEYFRDMAYPYAGLTVNVDITQLLQSVRKRKLPFFLTALYVMAQAANGVPELRRRIKNDSIIEYPHCNTSHTVALENGTYCYCSLDCSLPFEMFIANAVEKQEAAKKTPNISDGEDVDSLFYVSCIPWVSYSALIQPTPSPADSNPRITFGRYFMQNGKFLMPVSLLVHHALVDGKHISEFYQNIEISSIHSIISAK